MYDVAIAIGKVSAEHLYRARQQWVDLLRDVVDGGASVNFLPPLGDDVANAFWDRVAREVADGERIVLAATSGEVLAGCVHVVLAGQPNGQHRAEIQKMLVHSAYRRRGLGRALLKAGEEAALSVGRWLIVLDTERGSAAETMYRACGYQEAGVIPDFALDARGEYIATVLFYRKLK